MFDHTCTSCSQRYLIFPSQVTSIVNAADGITVSFECWCGAPQTQVSGHDVRPPAPTTRAA